MCDAVLFADLNVFVVTETKASDSVNGSNEIQSKKKKEKPVVKKRDSRAAFSHPWLACTLRSHSGLVLGIDFSPNGKYLASCSEGKHWVTFNGALWSINLCCIWYIVLWNFRRSVKQAVFVSFTCLIYVRLLKGTCQPRWYFGIELWF